jgi:ATP/maltotriose-dependent transcriptional regulator MalT
MDTIARQPRRPQPRRCPHPGARAPVPRAALLDLLEASSSTTVVAVLAPPGYGKTTLLAAWAERDPRSFAWLTIDRHDNDPAVLLRTIAAALDQIEPLDPALLETLRFPGRAAIDAVLPQLGSAVSAAALPVVLVLDDLHLLQNWDCLVVVARLIDYLPPGSQLAVASRGEPPPAAGAAARRGPGAADRSRRPRHGPARGARAPGERRTPRRPGRRRRAGPTDRGLAGGAPVRGLVLATFP